MTIANAELDSHARRRMFVSREYNANNAETDEPLFCPSLPCRIKQVLIINTKGSTHAAALTAQIGTKTVAAKFASVTTVAANMTAAESQAASAIADDYIPANTMVVLDCADTGQDDLFVVQIDYEYAEADTE